MKNTMKLAIISLLVLIANNIYASDLLVTPELSKNGETKITFDLLNDDGATSMQFDVNAGKLNLKRINLSHCVSGLQNTHQGACNIVDGKIRVLVYSMTNTPLESGTIGYVTLGVGASNENLLKSKSKLSVDNMKLSAPKGKNSIKGSVLIDNLKNENNK